MQATQIIQKLKGHHDLFQFLFSNLEPAEIHWKKQEGKWCLLEILCHLYDEELEDFRTRVQYCLERPEETLPPIDPVAWVSTRNYIGQNFEEKLPQFLQARKESIAWLESLSKPDWESGAVHPEVGKRSARFFLSNWLAHDYLHLRQITRLKYDYLWAHGGEAIKYAGNWVLE